MSAERHYLEEIVHITNYVPIKKMGFHIKVPLSYNFI